MLKELLKKSRSTREQYAFWGAVSTTGVIALVWFMVLSIDFKEGGPFKIDEGQQTASVFSQFFSELREDFLERQSLQEEVTPVDVAEVEVSPATSSVEIEEPVKGVPIMIGTSSPRSVQVGTSSSQNR